MASFNSGRRFSPADFKIPPHSIEAEQAVLGGLLLDKEAWDQVAGLLVIEDFYRPDHSMLFTAISALHQNNQACDLLTVTEWLSKQEKLEHAGGFQYIGQLAKETPSSANIEAYANIVREHSILRQLIKAGTEIVESAYKTEGREAKELLDVAEQKVFQIAEQLAKVNKSGPVNMKALMSKVIERIHELHAKGDSITGASTGFDDLDDLTSGLQRSDLVIIAGRPSMGKCIAEGSLVMQKNGQLTPIEKLAKNIEIISLNLDNNQLIHKPIIDFIKDGQKPVFEVITESGRSIKATLSHKFLTKNNDWQALENIKIQDSIALPARLPFFGIENTIESDEINEKLLSLNKNTLKIFLKHFIIKNVNYQNDNCIIKTTEPKLLQHLLLRLSIIAYKTPQNELILRNFNLETFIQNNITYGDIVFEKVIAINNLGILPVYDLTIAKTHNFIAEDMLVHNTSFAMNIAENIALKNKRPVAIFSMEMPGEQLAMRTLSSLGRIDQHKIRKGQLEDQDWPRLTSAVMLLSKANFFIDDTPGLSPAELKARARRLKREQGDLGLIVVDYLQLMQVPGMRENRALEISEISRSLKALAKELDVPVIALSQLNRSLEQRPNKRPVMSDLRESGSIEQDADLIIFIYRDEVYNKESEDKGTAEIIIAKQRNGPIGMVRLTFLGRYTRFDNYSPEMYTESE